MTRSLESLLQLAQHCIKSPRQIKQIHSILITSGYLLHNPNTKSDLKWKGTLLYNALIRGYHSAGFTQKAIILFTHMLANQAPPNSHTFPPLLKAASASNCPPPLGTALHSQALKRGVLSDPFIGTTLVTLYARNNNLDGARKVFEEISQWCLVSCNAMLNAFCTNGNLEAAVSLFESMPDRDVVSWTTVVNGFAFNGEFSAAIWFFRKMMSHRDVLDCLVRPNEATYVSVLSSCANLDGKSALDYGKQVHGYVVMNGANSGVFVGTSLINLYGKMGYLGYAIHVFKLMVSREVCTWNAMISSLASNSREKEALHMFEKMKTKGLKPNSITFTAVLTACARGKFVIEGLELFQSMARDFIVEPVMEHYGCVIDLLGRAGHLQEAADMIRNMPFPPDGSILGAFLGACRIHGEIELGEEIGRTLLTLQKEHSGQYVLLSSINADKERWNHAFDLRKEIMDAGIEKIPAYRFGGMDAIGGVHCGFWNWKPLPGKPRPRKRGRLRSNSGSTGGGGYQFPLKQALTAASLALIGDTIAQVRDRWCKAQAATKHRNCSDSGNQDELWSLLSDHDWVRALRMTSYGFLLYGPGSYAWYQCLDHFLPKPTVQNIMLKVLLNQIVLGPCVIAVVFAWNNLWQGKIKELPEKYQRDALPTLLYGFRFWIPVSALNFWLVPLQARVAYMSMGSIFWNFYLSSTMSK